MGLEFTRSVVKILYEARQRDDQGVSNMPMRSFSAADDFQTFRQCCLERIHTTRGKTENEALFEIWFEFGNDRGTGVCSGCANRP